MNTSASDLIQPRHLARHAVIYIRQSSLQQVLTNTESQRLQRALAQRVVQLGWPESAIDVFDGDLGRSASFDGRADFQRLAARVGLGEIGVIVAYDATRLARNCTHWYQLLDLCGRAGCLIADRDGVYEPASVNGRLLLGLKGAISELELHTLRGRLTAGILSKAERGELRLQLPSGFLRLDDGSVVQHPDQELRDRLKLIFDTLLEKKSLAKVVRHLQQHDLKVPRRDPLGDHVWRRPTMTMIRCIVRNPVYAGAFVYGRTHTVRAENTGKPRQYSRPMSEWRVLIRDKYPAYISWEEFERIQQMLQDNHTEYHRHNTRGVPRDGPALLQGILYCGECGHKLGVKYRDGARYVCNYLRLEHGEPLCQRLPSASIDEQVLRWFFEALSPAAIDLSAQTLAEADARREQLFSARRQQVQRLRYVAQRAERQYQHVEPENRLIAAELERRWEVALAEWREAQEQLARDEEHAPVWAIPADLLDALQHVGQSLPEMWQQGLFSSAQKKSLLRSLLDKVVVHRVGGRRGDRIHVRVVWRGGASTSADITAPVGRLADRSGAAEMKATITRLARQGQSDKEIAAILTSQGHRSAHVDVVLPGTVQRIRLSQGLLSRPGQSHPRHVKGYLTITQLTKKLKVSRSWIGNRIRNGTIMVTKDSAKQCYLFPDNSDTLRQFRQLLAGEISQLGWVKGHQDA